MKKTKKPFSSAEESGKNFICHEIETNTDSN